MRQLVDHRAVAAVDLAEVAAGRAAGIASGRLHAFEHAGDAAGEFGQAPDPVLGVRDVLDAGLVDARRPDLRGQRRDAAHRPHEEVREVEAMREHVADFAGAGLRQPLPPADGATIPVLKPLCAKVPGPADGAAGDQVMHVLHRRHESVSERGHVPHAGALGGHHHFLGLGHRQGQRFLAQHMAAAVGRGHHQIAVEAIGRRDDHGVNRRVLQQRKRIGIRACHAGDRRGLGQRRRVGIAESDDLGIAAEPDAGNVIGHGNLAGADESDFDGHA